MLGLLKVNYSPALLQLLAAWKRFELILRDLLSELEGNGVSCSFASFSQLELGHSKASIPPIPALWRWHSSRGDQTPLMAQMETAKQPAPSLRRGRSDDCLPLLCAAAEHGVEIAEQTFPMPTPCRFWGAGHHRAFQSPTQ